MRTVLPQSAILLLSMLAVGCASSPSEELKASDRTQGTGCDPSCVESRIREHLNLMGTLASDSQLESSLGGLRSLGPSVVRVVFDIFNESSRAMGEGRDPVKHRELQWRAVYLLGVLEDRQAVPLLYDIAREPLPDPRANQQRYADELRVRLRAIAGLETLKAKEEIQALHSSEGVLRNATTASLFSLGVAQKGVRLIDARTALSKDTADPRDFHPRKGSTMKGSKPGSEKFIVSPRPDTPKAER